MIRTTLLLFSLVMTIGASAADSKAKREPNTASFAQAVCESIHNRAKTDLIDLCKYQFTEFSDQQKFLGIAEMSKEKIKTNNPALTKMTTIGAKMISYAAGKKALISKGATTPDFGFDNGVGGGVTCTQAMDYSKDDEEGDAIPGQYACRVSTGVWIKYQNANCDKGGFYGQDEEMKIDFVISEDGKISKIKTRPLVLNSSCAA